MNKLIAQLTQELKRSPVKAAALAGGTLLAIWFWLPLLGDLFGSESKSSSSAVPSAEVAEPAFVAAASATPQATAAPSVNWRKIVAWQQAHHYAKSHIWLASMRNPFVAPAQPEPVPVVAEATPAEQQAEQQLAQDQSAEAIESVLASLQLTSTLIMPGQRLATISGKAYREGDPIDFGQIADDKPAGEQPSAMIVLRKIAPQSVTLQHGSELYPLRLKRPARNSISLELR